MYLKNCLLHLNTILKHKKEVFKLCIIAGIPFQGFIHDMSKFSPSEFFESAKYFTGKASPILLCKEKNGYSMAWQHHKGRNKHHPEWWVDKLYSGGVPIEIAYKYAVEMACDIIAASKTYNGKNFTNDMPYKHWSNRIEDRTLIHENSKKFVHAILYEYSLKGDKAIHHSYTKELYKKIKDTTI